MLLGAKFVIIGLLGGIASNPLNLRKTGLLGLARGPEFDSIYTVNS